MSTSPEISENGDTAPVNSAGLSARVKYGPGVIVETPFPSDAWAGAKILMDRAAAFDAEAMRHFEASEDAKTKALEAEGKAKAIRRFLAAKDELQRVLS